MTLDVEEAVAVSCLLISAALLAWAVGFLVAIAFLTACVSCYTLGRDRAEGSR